MNVSCVPAQLGDGWVVVGWWWWWWRVNGGVERVVRERVGDRQPPFIKSPIYLLNFAILIPNSNFYLNILNAALPTVGLFL